MYAQTDLSLCWSHISHCWKSHVAAHFKGMAVGVWLKMYYVVTERYENFDVTSWGSRSRLPERAITTVQAPGDKKKIPQSYG